MNDNEPLPAALFASQNLVTIGVSRALRQLNREDSVALVGFDDFPLADLLRPGISVISQDTDAQTHVVPTELIVRGSGEIRYEERHRG